MAVAKSLHTGGKSPSSDCLSACHATQGRGKAHNLWGHPGVMAPNAEIRCNQGGGGRAGGG